MIQKNKFLIIGMILILFSSIVISADNGTFEENTSLEKEIIENLDSLQEVIEENVNETEENKTIKIPLEEINNLKNITQNNSLTNLEIEQETNTETQILNKKTENTNEEVSPSSSPVKEQEIEKTLTKEVIKEKEISISLYKEGKKEIEGKIPESFTSEIKKTEKEIEENKKEVTVKSTEHLESALTVYTNIEETRNKEDIEVYWKNENKEVEITQYFDENDNGLIDRISWIVPHLSEQVFEVSVISIVMGESTEMIVEITNIDSSSNPVLIELFMNYTDPSSIECQINITNSTSVITTSSINSLSVGTNDFSLGSSVDLGPGNKTLEIGCWDISNNLTNANDSELFTITEKAFSITGIIENKTYLNNQPIPFDITSPEGTIHTVTLKGPSKNEPLPAASEEIIKGYLSEPGKYTLEVMYTYYAEPVYRNITFYVATIGEFSVNKENLNPGEVEFTININSPEKLISSFIFYPGDGTENQDYVSSSFSKNINIEKNYSSINTYNPRITFNIEGTIDPFEVYGPTIKVTDPQENNEAPVIELISPKNDEIIKQETVTFKYKPTDDKKIKSCTYELYINDGTWKELDYNVTDTTIVNGEEIEIKLTSFEDGDYTWYVSCEDNETKMTKQSRDFVVQTTNHEKEEEINAALDSLEEFIEKEKSFSKEEKEALEELGIDEELNYYSKRLVQINQDLGNNLKFIKDEALKKERTEETIKELEEIIENIPLSVEITDSNEYIKNSLIENLEEITKLYVEGKNIKLSPKEIRNLAKENELVQSQISTSTKLKKIKVEYKNKEEEYTLVKKELTLSNPSTDKILEYLPINYEEIYFKTKSKEVGENLFEIEISDLENEEIVYYIKENVELSDLKKTETVLFEENPEKKATITGYFSAPLSGKGNYLFYIAFFVFLIGALYFGKEGFKKIQMNIWKKEENVRRILDYSEKAKRSLQSDDAEIAKEYYHKIKEIYGLTPVGFRKYSFPTIRKIQIGIDRRDMMTFVREYESAKREKRIEDSKKIYESIKSQYKKLPQKHREKVYERVIKDQMKEEFSL